MKHEVGRIAINAKNSTPRQLLLLFYFLVLFISPAVAVDYMVSGITDPVAANGKYIQQSGQICGHDYWKHESQDIYIVYDDIYYNNWMIWLETTYDGSYFGSEDTPVAATPDLASWTYRDQGDGVPTFNALSAPTVTTQAVSSIAATTATGNGNLTSLGSPNPTQYGVCWNTSSTPTTANSKTTEGTASSTGAFTSSMTGLTASTTYYVRAYATNTVGTVYGSEVSFTTSAAATTPTVTTGAASGTNSTGTTLNGTVNANNASTTVTFEYGTTVAYGTTVTADQSPVTGTSNTSVGKAITGLSPNTKYHYRAVGVNSEGTTYGSDQTFTTSAAAPTVTTAAVMSIAATTATGNGNITSLGVPNPTAHGVCWNTTGNPTTANSKTNEGAASATGAFSSIISGLTPNTTYYARAYATNAGGTVYGTQVSFTTLAAPTVASPSSASVDDTTATLGGTVTALNGADVTERGVYWSTTSGFIPPDDGTKVSETGTWSSTGAFTVNVTGLPAGQTIYFKAFATNSAGTNYTSQSSFNTAKSDQAITFDALATKTYGDADFDLTAAADSGLSVSYTSSDATVAPIAGSTVTKKQLTVTADNKNRDYGQANPALTLSYTGFVAGESETDLDTLPTASCTATPDSPMGTYPISVAGGVDGNYSFTYQAGTLIVSPILPTVTTAAVSNLTGTTTVTGGNVISSGGANVTARGVCYATTENPTTADNTVASGSGTGEFTSSLTGLSPGTTYYVRAYAINSAATAYGSRISFTTPADAVVTDEKGEASITNGTLSGQMSGFDPDLPVTLETDAGTHTATLTIGRSETPTLTTVLSNVGAGAAVSVKADEAAKQRAIEITQPSGRKVKLVLVAFPQGANVGVDLGSSQILGKITNAAGQAMDVSIETTDSGGDITFTITWHPPVNNPAAKAVWTTPNGSMTIEADGLAPGAAFTVSLSYVGLNLGRTSETDLRVLKLDEATGEFTVAGTNDKAATAATGVLGDYGVDTTAKTVWVETNSLGTYAVGVPKDVVESVTTTITSYGCPMMAGIFMSLLFMGFVGLRRS